MSEPMIPPITTWDIAQRKKKFRLKRGALLSWELLESDAFRELTMIQARILLRFLQKRTWEDIPKRSRTGKRRKDRVYNSTKLAFTYTEAAEALGIKRASFHRAIIRLVELGFLDVDHVGGGLGRDYSRYNLSERWQKWGTPQFMQITKARVLQAGCDVWTHRERKGASNIGIMRDTP